MVAGHDNILSPFHQALKTAYISIKGDFLLPKEYHNIGHEHQWVVLDADFCICQLCGWDHVCFKGNCPEVRMKHSEHVCSISGCVVLLSEMKPEWGAAYAGDNIIGDNDLMVECCTSSGSNNSGKKMKTNSCSDLGKKKRGMLLTNTRKKMMRRSFASSAATAMPDASWHHPHKIMKGSMEVHEFVEIIVREILDSQKTLKCREVC